MFEFYFEDPKLIPPRKQGQSYKEWDNILKDFLKNRINDYKYSEFIRKNFWDMFREDLFEDPSYNYLVKLIYRENLIISKSKPTRKYMLSKPQNAYPFLRMRKYKGK